MKIIEKILVLADVTYFDLLNFNIMLVLFKFKVKKLSVNVKIDSINEALWN